MTINLRENTFSLTALEKLSGITATGAALDNLSRL